MSFISQSSYSKEELIACYRDHTIFLHPSILEAGHPNPTLLEAMSCGLPIVGTYEDDNDLPGLFKSERDFKQITKGGRYLDPKAAEAAIAEVANQGKK